MSRQEYLRIFFACILASIIISGLITWAILSKTPAGLAPSSGGSSSLVTRQDPIVNTVKKVNPAVVSITVSKNVPNLQQYFNNNPFGDLFNFSFPFPSPFSGSHDNQNQSSGDSQKQEIGGGSGFLISSNGYIVTNSHVVDDPNAEYTVFTNDGKKHSAKVVGSDATLDIAVIKIDGNNYSALQFGDSSKLEVGQTVIAIGNALGEFRNTVSVGVISGLSRSIVAGDILGGASESLDEVIQTDAAINPGNSGGPLLDLTGQVIGVNVAIVQGSENIGFALPANAIKNAISILERGQKIIRPYLGVRYLAITADLQSANMLPVDYGVLIARGQNSSDLAVIPGSPADKAGLQENDIILEVDGLKLTADQNLSTIVRNHQVGDTLTLKILHRGETKTLTVKLEAPAGNDSRAS